jgi:hypothetical protein
MPRRGHHMRRRKATPTISSTAAHRSIARYIMLSFLRNCVDTREGRKDYADGDEVVQSVEPHEIAAVIGRCVSRAERIPQAPVSKLIQGG